TGHDLLLTEHAALQAANQCFQRVMIASRGAAVIPFSPALLTLQSDRLACYHQRMSGEQRKPDMGRIAILSEHVVAEIGAGEVIARPASVLKELLENSVDAGATRLDVEVGQGGLEFLRVADNGSGIEAEDLPLAFATHATSKLRSAEDL